MARRMFHRDMFPAKNGGSQLLATSNVWTPVLDYLEIAQGQDHMPWPSGDQYYMVLGVYLTFLSIAVEFRLWDIDNSVVIATNSGSPAGGSAPFVYDPASVFSADDARLRLEYRIAGAAGGVQYMLSRVIVWKT